MAYSAGEIICLKTTGERVCVLSTAMIGYVEVRRPVIQENGAISHVVDNFQTSEVETLKEHGARQISEMILKAEAQKQLIQVENKLQSQIEDEELELKPTLVKKEPVLN